MDTDLFVRTYPVLYHMAHHEALPSILRHGLLSTSALLDLFEISGSRRDVIESRMRRQSILIEHPKHGKAVICDQKPIMNDRRLEESLRGTATASQFHRLLNSKVFFWLAPDRLAGLRGAVAYRNEPQLVFYIDTKRLVNEYGGQVMLCPMNSGSCKPFAHPRSPGMFQRIADYDFEYWRQKKGGAHKAVVECTVDRMIPDFHRFVQKSEIVG